MNSDISQYALFQSDSQDLLSCEEGERGLANKSGDLGPNSSSNTDLSFGQVTYPHPLTGSVFSSTGEEHGADDLQGALEAYIFIMSA